MDAKDFSEIASTPQLFAGELNAALTPVVPQRPMVDFHLLTSREPVFRALPSAGLLLPLKPFFWQAFQPLVMCRGVQGVYRAYTLELAGMAEHKPKDSSEVQAGRPELTSIKSKDAHEVVNPNFEEKAKAEAIRTNASSGSAGELALKSSGLSREQIAARMAEQDDSISIDYGGGKIVSRLNPGKEENMVAVGAESYDTIAIIAQNFAPGGVADATNAINTSASQAGVSLFETDKSKIFAKPIEATVSGVQATGLDYNSDGKPSNKLLHFVHSAAARAISPEARSVVQ